MHIRLVKTRIKTKRKVTIRKTEILAKISRSTMLINANTLKKVSTKDYQSAIAEH